MEARIISLVRRRGVLRPRDLDAHGLPRRYMSRLHARGVLARVGRGLYVLNDAPTSSNHTMALVAKRIPHGVVCLLSALRFHELTTQAPFEIWVAIDGRARKPSVPELPVRIMRFGGPALTEGIEEHRIEGVPVKIYGVAKTVADCFKFRNKIGHDVAIEALRDCRRQRKATVRELWEAAQVCRVSRVMKPYMEAIE